MVDNGIGCFGAESVKFRRAGGPALDLRFGEPLIAAVAAMAVSLVVMPPPEVGRTT